MASAGTIRAGKAFVIIEALDQTGAVLTNIRKRMGKFADDMGNTGRRIMMQFTAMMAGAGFAGAVYQSFDDSMKKVEARSKGTAAEMMNLRQEAKDLGRTTAFTASQVGMLMQQLAQMGFNRKQIDDMTQSILGLARAGGEGFDLGEDATVAANLTSALLKQWKLDASEAGTVADLLTVAVNSTAYNLQDLGTAFQYAGPIAAKFNMSIAETLATLGTLSQLGIDPSIAGTAFRNIGLYETNVAARDEFNAELQKQTGKSISFVDADNNLRPIQDILFAIGEAMDGLGTSAQGDLLSKFFGLRASVGASGIMDSMEIYSQIMAEMEASGGAAGKTAAKMESGIGGMFRMMLSAAEAVALAFGEKLEPVITTIGTKVVELTRGFADFISTNKTFAIQVALAVLAFGAFGTTLLTISFGLKLLMPLLGIAATLTSLLSSALWMVVGAFTGTIVKVIALTMVLVVQRVAVIAAYAAYGLLYVSLLLLEGVFYLAATAGVAFGLIINNLKFAVVLLNIAVNIFVRTVLIFNAMTNLAAGVLVAFYHALVAASVIVVIFYNGLVSAGLALGSFLRLIIQAGISVSILTARLAASIIMAGAYTVAVRLLTAAWKSTKAAMVAVRAAIIAVGLAITSWQATVTIVTTSMRLLNLTLWATVFTANLLAMAMAALRGAMSMSAIVGALTNPATIVLALLVGIGALIYVNRKTIFDFMGKTGTELLGIFGELKQTMTDWFNKILTTGKAVGMTLFKTFNAVTAALTIGDTAAAWEVGLQGLSLAWNQFADGIMYMWEDVTTFFYEAWLGASTKIAQSILGLAQDAGILGDAINALLPHDVRQMQQERNASEAGQRALAGRFVEEIEQQIQQAQNGGTDANGNLTFQSQWGKTLDDLNTNLEDQKRIRDRGDINLIGGAQADLAAQAGKAGSDRRAAIEEARREREMSNAAEREALEKRIKEIEAKAAEERSKAEDNAAADMQKTLDEMEKRANALIVEGPQGGQDVLKALKPADVRTKEGAAALYEALQNNATVEDLLGNAVGQLIEINATLQRQIEQTV